MWLKRRDKVTTDDLPYIESAYLPNVKLENPAVFFIAS